MRGAMDPEFGTGGQVPDRKVAAHMAAEQVRLQSLRREVSLLQLIATLKPEGLAAERGGVYDDVRAAQIALQGEAVEKGPAGRRRRRIAERAAGRHLALRQGGVVQHLTKVL